MKKAFIYIAVLTALPAASGLASTKNRGARADVTCAFADSGKYTFHIDLRKATVPITHLDSDEEAAFAAPLKLEAHFAYPSRKFMNEFDLDLLAENGLTKKGGGPIGNIALRGNNGDDTDYLVIISYDKGGVHATLTSYIDSAVGSAESGDAPSVETGKSCSMVIK